MWHSDRFRGVFLPISAGAGGFWPLVVATVIVGPVIWLAHRGLARFVLSSKEPGCDLTAVAEEHFGAAAGMLITLLYFLAVYPLLLIYAVGLTNTVNGLLVSLPGMPPVPRPLLALIVIVVLMSVVLARETVMLKVTGLLVYPLVGILVFLSLCLIPHWSRAALTVIPGIRDFTTTLWLALPVLVLSFNHSPAISAFALALQREYGAQAEQKASQILCKTAAVLLVFVMLFVFSCVLAVTPQDLARAKGLNISMLSCLADKFDNPLLALSGPLAAILALSSSFFGYYLGAREGLQGLVKKMARHQGKSVEPRKLNIGIAVFFLVTLWAVATLNPGIPGMAEVPGGLIILVILFMMPVYAIRRVPAMAGYAGRRSNVFITLAGGVAILAMVCSLW